MWGLIVLVIAVALYVYRVVVEDKAPLRWKLPLRRCPPTGPRPGGELALRDRPAGRRPHRPVRMRCTVHRSAPKITITCDCGEQRKLAYGDGVRLRVRPLRGRRSRSRRPTTRRSARSTAATGARAGSSSAASGCSASLGRRDPPDQLLFLIPAGMMTWFTLFRPMVRRRHWRAIQALTRRWTLRAE